MRRLTYSMNVSLDGYIVGPDGTLDWSPPDDDVFRLATDEVQQAGVYLLGRRLYETMLYWESAEREQEPDELRLAFGRVWRALPKVVFSTTLTAVQGRARLASAGLAEEVERLRAQPGAGDIAIGGATLAAEADGLGLIDEYRMRVHPVLVGGGTLFFSQRDHRADLEPVEARPVGPRVLYLRYRRAAPSE